MTFVAIPDKAAGDGVTLAMWDAIKDNLNKGVLRPISHTELGASASTVTISSIAADWVDLLLIVRTRQVATRQGTFLRFNGDTGANYGYQVIYWNPGVLCTSLAAQTQLLTPDSPDSGSAGFAATAVLINNYANSTTHKTATWWMADGDANAYHQAGSGYWASTSAITSVTSLPGAGSYDVGSTFTLYGVSGI